MPSPNKRSRGRPVGSGKDDAPTLSRLADLILANPKMRPTTAMKRLDIFDPSVIRRLQGKWRIEADHHMAQARARHALATAPSRRPNSSYSPRAARQIAGAHRIMNDALGMSHFAAIQAALENPTLRAAREMMNTPEMLAAQETARRYRESPAMQAIQEFQNSPTMQAMRELQGSPAVQAAREVMLEAEKIKRLLGGGF